MQKPTPSQQHTLNKIPKYCAKVARRRSWLLDARLDDARLRLSAVILKMQQCEEWSADLESLWHQIQETESAVSGMGAFMGLTETRRDAGASIAELSHKWQLLSNELHVVLCNLQKVGGRVLDEYLKQAQATSKVPGVSK